MSHIHVNDSSGRVAYPIAVRAGMVSIAAFVVSVIALGVAILALVTR